MDCEKCVFYFYDDDIDDYVCDANLDEDEYARLYALKPEQCPYYREYDEYKTAAKQ